MVAPVQRSWIRRVTYNLSRVMVRLFCVVLFRIRCLNRSLVPAEGGALVCSNHQSYLDPLFVGLACDRRMNFLARESLFGWTPFRWVLEWYDTIPIQREGFGLTGMRETLRRLRRGELVVVFPEGTRTHDGRLQPLKPGICTLARRAHVPLVPVVIEGAFDAWPRQQRLPCRASVRVAFGPPITVDEVARMTDEQLLKCLSERLQQSRSPV